MKDKKLLFVILGSILFLLVGSTVYVNFFCKNLSVMSYIIFAQIFLGVISSIFTLFLGSTSFKKKSNSEIMLISFLEVILVLGIVILNTTSAYHNLVNYNNYLEYMEYVSMYFNIYIFIAFSFIIGLLNINLFINEKTNIKE